MALPTIAVPEYTLILPSTGKELKYRPFLVKEEKSSQTETIFHSIVKSIDYIYDNENTYPAKDHTEKELSDFMDKTKKQEGELTEKTDQVILEKLKAGGYKKFDAQNLFEILYKDDKIREKIMNETELQTDGDLQKINQHKENLLKALDDLLLETYQMEPILIDEARLVTGEEGCVCNIDIERIENDEKSGLIDSKKMSASTKEKISALIDQVLTAIT